MNIDIASKDERYLYLCEALKKDGHIARVVSPNEVFSPDALILPIKPEHTENELYKISKKISEKTKVLFGGGKLARQIFEHNLYDYSENEYFLGENARITAEAFLTVWQASTKASFEGQKILITGYGRIGKNLAKMLSSLGAKIHVYARREETKKEIKSNGFYSVNLDFAKEADAVINTAPAILFDSKLLLQIPESTKLFELASVNGFEKTERVYFALGLPGKILPKTAAEAIYKSIISFLD